jgi:hypothetical protein
MPDCGSIPSAYYCPPGLLSNDREQRTGPDELGALQPKSPVGAGSDRDLGIVPMMLSSPT